MTKKNRTGVFAPGNTGPDGGYIVGKNQPPVDTRFKAGDKRPRGLRVRGTRNLATDLRDELEGKVEVSVNGFRKMVSRQRAVIMRLAEKASRGDTRAMQLMLEYQQRIVEPLLVAEVVKASQKTDMDLSVLTVNELSTLEYLMCKASGEAYTGDARPYIEMLNDETHFRYRP